MLVNPWHVGAPTLVEGIIVDDMVDEVAIAVAVGLEGVLGVRLPDVRC